MWWIYNRAIAFYSFSASLASLFNDKARKWVRGRRGFRAAIESSVPAGSRVIWIHAASLGEMEQGIPILKAIRKEFPHKKIYLSFYSPSGFENFKDDELVDYKFYLQPDTRHNAQFLLDHLKVEMALFIKYEIWPHYLRELTQREIPTIIAPAVFRRDHIYFKNPARHLFLPLLQKVNRILVQDIDSCELLRENGLENVEVSGDTRFERVVELVNTPFSDDLVERFCGDHFVLIGGSTWPEDEDILIRSLSDVSNLKVILAPHNIDPGNIARVKKLFGPSRTCLYSENPVDVEQYDYLIIDNIGMLSRLYRYSDAAFIGGGYKDGVHSTIEAAAYGQPVFFGPDHKSFIEPGEMIRSGFGHEIANSEEFTKLLSRLLSDDAFLKEQKKLAREYSHSKTGATRIIMSHIHKALDQHSDDNGSK